jgi:hypothetical protein
MPKLRQKMAESRQRRQEQRERVKRMLAESRSAGLALASAELSSVPGLVDALNGLTAGLADRIAVEGRDEFDLKRYESHIRAHIQDVPSSLAGMPSLRRDARKDLIWRFIAAIFLAHMGVIDIWQQGRDVMVMKHETDREGQDVPGEPEGHDGLEGSLGRAEAF